MGVSGNNLLSEEEAVALLQPHLHNQSLASWLARDRQRDPVIHFVLIEGQPFYQEEDVVNFIKRLLAPSASFVHVHDHLINERRSKTDRRRQVDRRHAEWIRLQPGIERRHWGELDRRLRGELHRRSQPDMA